MTATCSCSRSLGTPLLVLHAVITDLENHPDMRWIIGEPVSSGLLLVAEGQAARIRPAPDVTFMGDDEVRVLRIIDTTLAADTAWPPRTRRKRPAQAGPTTRERVASLGRAELSLSALKRLARALRGRAELQPLLGADPRAALFVVADAGRLHLEAAVARPLTEEGREELERVLRDVMARELG